MIGCACAAACLPLPASTSIRQVIKRDVEPQLKELKEKHASDTRTLLSELDFIKK